MREKEKARERVIERKRKHVNKRKRVRDRERGLENYKSLPKLLLATISVPTLRVFSSSFSNCSFSISFCSFS